MTDLNVLLAERACQRLMLEYCECVDTRQFDRLVSLFGREGILNRIDTGEIKGHAAITEFFDKLTTDPLIHAATNLLVTVTGPETAEAVSYVTVYRSYRQNATGQPKLEAPYVVAKYVDKFIVEDGEWKIGYRDTIFAAKE
ncbi:MAG: nuclear transport factor 2 family protein [Hyphomicrobiales bacterium]|nr:nuclear transport factor 2 family protein [Hyphomicrobiales bacterium]